jgi:hypothetical protein
VLKLEISYRVMISWRILVSFRGFFFEDFIFAWGNIWISIIFLLPWDTFWCKWQGHSVTHPLVFLESSANYKFILCLDVNSNAKRYLGKRKLHPQQHFESNMTRMSAIITCWASLKKLSDNDLQHHDCVAELPWLLTHFIGFQMTWYQLPTVPVGKCIIVSPNLWVNHYTDITFKSHTFSEGMRNSNAKKMENVEKWVELLSILLRSLTYAQPQKNQKSPFWCLTTETWCLASCSCQQQKSTKLQFLCVH